MDFLELVCVFNPDFEWEILTLGPPFKRLCETAVLGFRVPRTGEENPDLDATLCGVQRCPHEWEIRVADSGLLYLDGFLGVVDGRDKLCLRVVRREQEAGALDRDPSRVEIRRKVPVGGFLIGYPDFVVLVPGDAIDPSRVRLEDSHQFVHDSVLVTDDCPTPAGLPTETRWLPVLGRDECPVVDDGVFRVVELVPRAVSVNDRHWNAGPAEVVECFDSSR